MASGGLGSQYGSYNPAAVDPYPIETNLAAKAFPDSAQAFSALNLYQDQRLAAANQYGQELDKQHEFNRQQLAQQLAEAKMKAIPEFAKTPGGARFLANMGIDVGADPGALTGLANQSDQAQQATNLEHLGSGASSFSNAGMPIPEASVRGMTGLPFVQGTRPDITIEGMKDATHLQAASISAGGKGPKTTYRTALPFNADGSQTQIETSGVRDPSQGEAILADHQRQADAVNARRTGQSTTSQSGGSGAQLDTNSQAGQAAQNGAIKFSQNAKDAGAKAGPYQKDAQKAHQDVEANRNGAVYVTRQTPKGPVVVGKSGAEYPL